ncbi:endonuclease domain-containing protein [Dehalogenimonas alkenigignens]|uniref:endonuclease domain-containing protein n=1 Tax=Dehalogenimonas alkenigignens TaxID=1217799 RepID=UPI000D56B6CB|nr:endonuclease domain-containing protein [Dehalogenimonas alkenigignens]PVV82891.1 hypothetical protein DD509_07835 [Dehalogenimonas alkenigignens]
MEYDSAKNLGRALRRRGTPAERVLWLKLRNRQMSGYKFRRQQTIGSYIVDFVCFEKKLIIEIDGGQHSQDEIIDRDEIRTNWLNRQGFCVIRFWNNEVLENLEGVVMTIRQALANIAPSPLSSSPIEGEENRTI